MIDPEEILREFFVGEEFRPHDQKSNWECDFCSKGVNYSSKARKFGTYLADDVLGDNPLANKAREMSEDYEITWMSLATYCRGCSVPRLYFPCEGFDEIRAMVTIEGEIITDLEVADHSPSDDGIPWDPIELTERIQQVPFDMNPAVDQDLWGPENMATWFMAIGPDADIREFVDYEGNIDDRAIGRARKAYKKFVEAMEEGNFERTAFREYVQNGR